MLEVYEIYDCLPEHMKEPFKRVLEMRGEPMKLSPPKRNQGQMRVFDVYCSFVIFEYVR